MSKERSCETCRHWISFCAEFDDPLEPDDVGDCQLDLQFRHCDEICNQWEGMTCERAIGLP